MKQHITIDQFNELNYKQQEKLLEIFGAGYEYINIGKMIEFLDEHYPISIIGHQSQWHGGKWYFNGGKIPQTLTEESLKQSTKTYENNNLFDALFEAVKEILNKE